jgi:peptide deformylase
MTKLPTIYTPAKEGILAQPHPKLRQVSTVVEDGDFGTDELKEFVQYLKNMCATSQGLGLAAPQVGVCKRVFVARDPNDNEYTVYINPVITPIGEETFNFKEGCLSVVGFYGVVNRPRCITIDYVDVYGVSHTDTKTMLASTVLQHEYDHLEGIEFTDRMSKFSKRRAVEKMKKQKRKGKQINLSPEMFDILSK